MWGCGLWYIAIAFQMDNLEMFDIKTYKHKDNNSYHFSEHIFIHLCFLAGALGTSARLRFPAAEKISVVPSLGPFPAVTPLDKTEVMPFG